METAHEDNRNSLHEQKALFDQYVNIYKKTQIKPSFGSVAGKTLGIVVMFVSIAILLLEYFSVIQVPEKVFEILNIAIVWVILPALSFACFACFVGGIYINQIVKANQKNIQVFFTTGMQLMNKKKLIKKAVRRVLGIVISILFFIFLYKYGYSYGVFILIVSYIVVYILLPYASATFVKLLRTVYFCDIEKMRELNYECYLFLSKKFVPNLPKAEVPKSKKLTLWDD